MTAFVAGVGVIASLEIRQRVRGTAVWVLLSIFVGLMFIVTALLTIAFAGFGSQNAGGGEIFSTIIYFVLLLGTLVAPALSGNSINGDRDAGTLATTQVTLITTWQLIIGKFLSAWAVALVFLGAAVPFLVYSVIVGRLGASTIIVSTLVLAVELGVVAAIGVGLSGLLDRPLLSIVSTYLIVATLSIGTLIAFSLGGLAVQTQVTSRSSYGTEYDADGFATACAPAEENTYPVPRFDYLWGVLVANPYVVLADSVPTTYDSSGNPTDAFGYVKLAVRSAQIAPEPVQEYDECSDEDPFEDVPTARETIESTVPGWFVGILIHLLLSGGALVGAWAKTRTPAGRLSRGSRIA